MNNFKWALIDYLVNSDDLKPRLTSLMQTDKGFRVVWDGKVINVSLSEG